MNKNLHFNIQATSYVPKDKRAPNKKDDIEVVYEYQNQSYHQNQYDKSYQQNNYANENKYSNQKNYNQNYTDKNKTKYGGEYQNEQVYANEYDNYNQYDGEYDNQYKLDNYNYYSRQGKNSNQKFNNNYQHKAKWGASQNYNTEQTDQSYVDEQGIEHYWDGYRWVSSTPISDNTNTYTDAYSQNEIIEKKYNNKNKKNNYQVNSVNPPVNNKNKTQQSQSYIVEKVVKVSNKVNQQDLEDDNFDDVSYEANTIPYTEHSDNLEGDDFYGDYEDDLEYNESNYDYYEGDFNETSDQFSNMRINNTDNMNMDIYNKSTTTNKKNNLIFTNKEGFTNYVDEITKQKYSNQITDGYVSVLMIAEKPSIAKAISEALGGNRYKMNKMGKGGCLISFDGYFGNSKAKFTVSSVMGHIYTSDYQKIHNDWDSIDYLDLYDVPIEKVEANKKTYVPSNLNRLARGKDILCLWLDCDKEGENICYEVIYNTYPYMNKKRYQQIYRAKFSSLTKPDLKAAFDKLHSLPNKNESLSVDARQVIDLKIGVSFTRFLTKAILPGIKTTSDLKFLSYGPCQTPTLWFCVNRQQEIDRFKSKEYFKVHADIEINKKKYKVPYCKKFFDKNELNDMIKTIKECKTAKVVDVITKKNSKQPPAGLNTVQMLRTASSYLKMSPHQTMLIAEKLYTMGYITYPRTETTKYASSFDFKKALGDFINHSTFGKGITALLKNFKKPVLRGVDIGDHPPITPSRVASHTDLKGDQWRLYEFICINFFSSVSDSAEYEEKVYKLDLNGEVFEADSMQVTVDGFLTFMTWKRENYSKDFPVLGKNQEYPVSSISSESHWTEPLGNLTESDLIKLMEQNKIGTDASMAVHIENICARNYVKADSSRKLIPTKLGKALIESLSLVDPELVQPSIRADIENCVDQIAKGSRKYEDVLSYAVQIYKKKFLVVRQHYEKLLNAFKKYFDVDLMGMNKVYRDIKSKNESLKIQSMVKKE